MRRGAAGCRDRFSDKEWDVEPVVASCDAAGMAGSGTRETDGKGADTDGTDLDE